jgi:glycogen synthase kinase 3 beta
VTPDSIDFLSKLLDYTPTNRPTAIEAMTHHFFDEIRKPETRLPSGKELPELFTFSPLGFFINNLELSIRPDLSRKLVPPHAEAALKESGIDLEKFQPVVIQKPVFSND